MFKINTYWDPIPLNDPSTDEQYLLIDNFAIEGAFVPENSFYGSLLGVIILILVLFKNNNF